MARMQIGWPPNAAASRLAGWSMAISLGAAMLIGAAPAQVGSLRAGAARVEVTPPLNPGEDPPTGRYAHEHLYARAIVIDNGNSRGALLAIDAGGLDDKIWQAASSQIAKTLRVPVANILISATHTHSGGGAGFMAGKPGPGLSVDQQRMVDGLTKAAQQAAANLQPAEVAFGTGTAYLNVNRDAIQSETHSWTQAPNTVAPSDKTVAVLKFQALSGAPIGVYVNYAMHPINGYLANFTSADFPGAMTRYVEQAYGDTPVVIFSQGASGDQNPLYMRPSTNGLAARSNVPITGNVLVRESVEEPIRDKKVTAHAMDAATRDRLERWMETEGDVLGEEVIRVMTNATRTERAVRIAGSQTEVQCPGRTRTDQGREGAPGSYVDGPPVTLRLGMIGIGDVALTSVDGEIYTLIGQRLKRQSPMANMMMVTLANGSANSGYIPDDASFGHETFQVLGSKLKIGCAEDSIADGLTRMTAAYMSGGK